MFLMEMLFTYEQASVPAGNLPSVGVFFLLHFNIFHPSKVKLKELQ